MNLVRIEFVDDQKRASFDCEIARVPSPGEYVLLDNDVLLVTKAFLVANPKGRDFDALVRVV